MTFKTNILFTIIVLFLALETAKSAQCDSVIIHVCTDTVRSNALEKYLRYEIDNRSSDTLLTFEDIYIEGLSSTSIMFPLPTYFCPNLLFFRPVDGTRDEGDGKYRVKLDVFPKLFVIPSMSKRTILIETSNFANLLSSIPKWKANNIFVFAKQNSFDSLIRRNFIEIANFYKNSFNNNDTLFANLQVTDSIKDFSIFKGIEEPGFYDSIESVFNIRIFR